MAGASFAAFYPLFPFRRIPLSSHLIPAAHNGAATIQMADDKTPHPSLDVIGGGSVAFLPALKTLNRPYNPFPLVGQNPHFETIFASFLRVTPYVRYKRECIRTKDSGSIALDWVVGDSRRLPPDSPVLILLVRTLFMHLW